MLKYQTNQTEAMPGVEALCQKLQPLPIGKDQLLEYLSEQVAKEFFYFLSKTFGSLKKCRTFAAFQQEQHLFKVAKLLFNNISVKVSYSSNAIQTKSVSSCWNNTHSRILLFFYLMFQQEKTTVDTMPIVEALYRKIQPLPIGKD